MLTGKQRSYLKKEAQPLQPKAIIGRAGLTDTVLTGIDQYLTVHELMKVSIQEGAELDAKETANEVASRLHAEFVQAIGRRFVLYRRAKDPSKRQYEEALRSIGR